MVTKINISQWHNTLSCCFENFYKLPANTEVFYGHDMNALLIAVFVVTMVTDPNTNSLPLETMSTKARLQEKVSGSTLLETTSTKV
jgi:hypothetical protein